MKHSKCVEVWVVEIVQNKVTKKMVFDSQEEMNDWLASKAARKIIGDHSVDVNFWQM